MWGPSRSRPAFSRSASSEPCSSTRTGRSMIEASPRSHDRKAPPTMLDRQGSEKQRTGGNRPDRSVEDAKATALVAELIARARKAQAIANQYDQAITDL